MFGNLCFELLRSGCEGFGEGQGRGSVNGRCIEFRNEKLEIAVSAHDALSICKGTRARRIGRGWCQVSMLLSL